MGTLIYQYFFFQYISKGCLLYYRIEMYLHHRLINLNTCLALIFHSSMVYVSATCVDKGVFLHVGLLMKSFAAVLTRIWPCITVYQHVCV